MREVLLRQETVYNPHQFTGRQYDAESGLYHYRARAYSADIGRFMQQDPAGMVDGANMYAYCGNNPVNRRDPSGMVASTFWERETMQIEPGPRIQLPWNVAHIVWLERITAACFKDCLYYCECTKLPNKYTTDSVCLIIYTTWIELEEINYHLACFNACYSDCYYGSILRMLLRHTSFERRPHEGPAWTHI